MKSLLDIFFYYKTNKRKNQLCTVRKNNNVRFLIKVLECCIIGKGDGNMSCFDRFDKKEKIIARTIEIDDNFYEILERLSKEIYDASINKLVNACIDTLIKTENIQTYKRESQVRLTRTFLIRESLLKGLNKLKKKYGIPIYLLVNIAVRNALIEEGLIE